MAVKTAWGEFRRDLRQATIQALAILLSPPGLGLLVAVGLITAAVMG